MPSGAIELFVVLLLVILNGFLSMAEIAMVSSRKTRLQQMAEAGDAGAQTALELISQPGDILSTVQVGITLIGILAGAFGGATLADELSAALRQIPVIAPYSGTLGVALVVLVITYLSLVVGELAPKQLGLNDAERLAAAVAPSMKFLSRALAPVVRLLNSSTFTLLRLFRFKPSSDLRVTEEEIRIMMEQGTEVGVFEPIEEEIVEQVFRLSDRRVSALMTPRMDIVWLDLDDSPAEIHEKIISSGFSRFPVARESLEEVLGVVQAKDLLAQALSGQSIDLQAAVQPVLFLPESLPAFDALEQFRDTHVQLAMVLDEYGGIQGILSTTDILEAIAGEFPDRKEAQDPDIVQREDGSWLLDGRLSIEVFKDLFDIPELPLEEQKYYQTLGGFVMNHLGRIPSEGDHFEWKSLKLEVMDMDGRRVDKVLIKQVGEPEL